MLHSAPRSYSVKWSSQVVKTGRVLAPASARKRSGRSSSLSSREKAGSPSAAGVMPGEIRGSGSDRRWGVVACVVGGVGGGGRVARGEGAVREEVKG